MAASALSHPKLDAGSWELLSPPADEGVKIEVGVVEVHPSSNRVAYATRARGDQSADLGKARIVIDEFGGNETEAHPRGRSPGRGSAHVRASFTLRELTKQINDFRTKSHVSMMAASGEAHPQEILQSFSATTTSIMPYTVQMLGAVQNLSFLTRDAIICQVPPGYVKEEPSKVQRLLVGFRRCIVVVSVFHLKHQKKEPYAHGVQVMAYMGPDDWDEYENDDKARKRQPSSFPVPITEHILAYGSYDGGIRFYDTIRRKQAKSALGPNGRGNPVVRVMNANRMHHNQGGTSEPHEPKMRRTNSCQTILPRIVSVCASGVAYLWELDLSIDLDTGEVLYFDIPPPLASFDGLVAAVSGKGIPAKYPPTLSPKSIAALSPLSSWEQTDEVNSQFELSFDSGLNLLFWAFSPDCVGSTLTPNSSREERLKTDGILVCWDLTSLPRQEWPPSVLAPRFVVQLPRTETGRVSSDMVIPSIHVGANSRFISSFYITSSCELMLCVADLEMMGGSVQLVANVMTVTDLKSLNCGKGGYVCYSVAVSQLRRSVLAIGTQFGVLFGSVSETLSDQGSSSDKISQHQVQAEKIAELVSRNKVLARKLEAKTILSDKERDEYQSRVKELMNQNSKELEASAIALKSIPTKVEAMQNDSRLKTEPCQSNAEVRALKDELNHLNDAFQREKQINEDISQKLAAAEGKASMLEQEASARNYSMKAVQDECDDLRKMLEEMKKRRTLEGNDRESCRNSGMIDALQKELSSAKETEVSLRNYISLLEEDKSIQDKELDEAKQKAEEYANKYESASAEMQADMKEQKSAIDSLVDLLERQKIDNQKENADQNDFISELKKQLLESQQKYQTDVVDKNKANEEIINRLQAENAIMRADASTGNEIFLAMKVQLQNALNELAHYQHEHKSKPP